MANPTTDAHGGPSLNPTTVSPFRSDEVRGITIAGIVAALVIVGAGSLVRPGPGPSWVWGGAVVEVGAWGHVWRVVSWLGVVALVVAWARLVRLSGRSPLAVPTAARIVAWWAVPFALGPTLFSNDVSSYVAQGQIVARGLDPFSVGPDVLGRAPIVHMVSPIWAHTPAPYGPVWLWLDGAISAVTGQRVTPSIVLLRLVAILSVMVIGWCLVRLARHYDADPGRVLVVGLANPLVLFHFVSGAHNEALMSALLLVGLLLAVTERPILGIIVVGLAASVKIPAAAGLLVIGWGMAGTAAPLHRKLLSTALATLGGLGVVALASEVTGFGFGWIHALNEAGRVRGLESPSGAAALIVAQLDTGLGHPWSVATLLTIGRLLGLAAAAVAATVLIMRGRHAVAIVSLGAALLAAFLLSPTIQPWYLAAPVALMAFTSKDWKLAVVVTVGVAYGLMTLPSGGGILFLTGAAGPWFVPVLAAGFIAWQWRLKPLRDRRRADLAA